MNSQPSFFQLSEEDEQIVRTYECTQLRKLFMPPTIGYLTVTNKRVVYSSIGRSLTGRSMIINEMPLEDAAGVSVYLGTGIRWLMFVLFFVIVYGVLTLVSSVLPSFFTGWIFALLLMLPYSFIELLESGILSANARNQVYEYLKAIFRKDTTIEEQVSDTKPVAMLLFVIGMTLLGWAIVVGSDLFSETLLLRILILAVMFFGLYLYTLGRPRTFNLTIGSKTMKGSGINIAGDTFRIFSNRVALDTTTAHPARDAEEVSRELGALLMDLRQLGDLGIAKWQRASEAD